MSVELRARFGGAIDGHLLGCGWVVTETMFKNEYGRDGADSTLVSDSRGNLLWGDDHGAPVGVVPLKYSHGPGV